MFKIMAYIYLYCIFLQDDDVESRAGQVRRHASFSSRDSEKTEQQAAIKRHASSESHTFKLSQEKGLISCFFYKKVS